jgi:nitrogen regulatory protein PII
MQYPIRKLVTIITEAQIERDLTRDLESHGVLGYTITDARGRGTHGERSSSWSMSGNIRVEVICEAAHADELMSYLRDRYYQNYAMVVFAHDVEVMRPDKFR